MKRVYEVTIERTFSAAHALLIRGVREPVHGHDWRLAVVVAGRSLDEDELLVDFHALEAAVDAIIAPFRNADLNAVAPFDRVNPSAEAVARHVADRIAAALPDLGGAAGLAVAEVRVGEAPGCTATVRPDGAGGDR